jgi:hypothetical protein
MAAGLPALERADILAKWADIVLNFFPTCEAAFFATSGKLLPASALHSNPHSGPARFLHGGLNIRFFRVQNSEDMVVDTLGLYALGLPEVQLHFHTADPNAMVRYAGNVALYQFQNNAPIQNGETVDAAAGLDQDQWPCQYEDSLIQPLRTVLDIRPGPFAAGTRTP